MNRSDGLPEAPTASDPVRFLIVLCTHNGQQHLRGQLESFVAQTHAQWALEIHDWASQDETLALIESFQQQYGARFSIKLTRHDHAPGPSVSFMQALRTTLAQRADFDWLLFADQDDVWVPEKLAEFAHVVRAQPDVALIYSDFALIDEQNRMVASHCLRQGGAWGRGMNFSHPVALMINVVHGMAMGVSRSFLTRWSAAWHNPDWFMHDWAMVVVAYLAQAPVHFLPQSLTLYRRHGGNFTLAFWGWRKFFAPFALLGHARRFVRGVHRQYQSLAGLTHAGLGCLEPGRVGRWRAARAVWGGNMFPWTVTVQLVVAFLVFWPWRRPAGVGRMQPSHHVADSLT